MLEIKAIQTRRLDPPRDSLRDAFETADLALQERDILVVASKAISIDEGRCFARDSVTRDELIAREGTGRLIGEKGPTPFDLVLNHAALLPAAGIDISNGGGYYILLPEDPFASAKRWHADLCARFGLKELGVIISDSHVMPLRAGCVDLSLGFWGFNPLHDYRGSPDLFGEVLAVSQNNYPDSLAAAAGALMGQGAESCPAACCRGLDGIQFDAEKDYKDLFLMDPERDVYTPFLKQMKDI